MQFDSLGEALLSFESMNYKQIPVTHLPASPKLLSTIQNTDPITRNSYCYHLREFDDVRCILLI
jgi:hypothetical protein